MQRAVFAQKMAYQIDRETGEIQKEQLIHIYKSDNIGPYMNIDFWVLKFSDA